MPFFDTLSAHLQETLLHTGQQRLLQPGEVLIQLDACDSTLYLLQSGTLQVAANAGGLIAGISITAGEVVGEIAFLDNRPRTATVIASEP